MKPLVIGYLKWEQMVRDLTGLEYSPKVDNTYELFPIEKTLPKWFLKTRPYETDSDDCDDRSKYAYCEIHDKHRRVPIVLVRGRVTGFGQHEFLIVGGLDSQGVPRARYCHRLTDEFEWISSTEVTKVDSLW